MAGVYFWVIFENWVKKRRCHTEYNNRPALRPHLSPFTKPSIGEASLHYFKNCLRIFFKSITPNSSVNGLTSAIK